MNRYDAILEHMGRWEGAPFVWGQSDCAIVAADAVQRLTGEPVLPEWPTYKTEAGALKAIRKLGFKSFAAAVTANLKELGPLEPTLIGDNVAIKPESGKWPSLAVSLGADNVLGCFAGRWQGRKAWWPEGQRWGVR